ncbi:MAG: hypothetical protein J0H15_08825 [Xanthomonadales bacterium]|nr:hypothetical protein [Xanthomonadales bacterium]
MANPTLDRTAPLWQAVLMLLGLLLAAPAGAATWYVRPDGGSAAECTGKADAAYPGEGRGRDCAWRHPFEALPPGAEPRMQGGDILLIGRGSYEIGRGAPGSEALPGCSGDWPWDCHVGTVPGGSPGQPTRILGAGWDQGCASAPELWGSQRAATVLDLAGSHDVEIACLELTDHSSCIEFHPGAAACQRDRPPYGAWAAIGIQAADSARVRLADLFIHGLAHDGIRAGRLRDWSLQRVRLVGNGWSGWNGDLGDGKGSSSSGQLRFQQVEIAWNGCSESWPGGEHPACWGQEQGGYGDGLGLAASSGEWLFEDVKAHHNAQDGLDLLHAEADADIVFRHVEAYANAGNQLKAAGNVTVEDSRLDGDCALLAAKGLRPGDACRAAGNSLILAVAPFSRSRIHHNRISGTGDCLIDLECAGEGCRRAAVEITGNELSGSRRKDVEAAKSPCAMWVGEELRGAAIEFSGNRLQGLRPPACPEGARGCAPAGQGPP